MPARAESSGPVQTQPLGLLGLLQIKNSGVYPDTLLGTVAPIIDAGEWIRQTNALDSPQGTIAVNAAGSSTFAFPGGFSNTIPDREWWYFPFATIACSTIAGEAVKFALALRRQPGGTTNAIHVLTPYLTLGATDQGRVGAQNFWAPPGSQLLVHVATITTAATISFFLEECYTPMRV